MNKVIIICSNIVIIYCYEIVNSCLYNVFFRLIGNVLFEIRVVFRECFYNVLFIKNNLKLVNWLTRKFNVLGSFF